MRWRALSAIATFLVASEKAVDAIWMRSESIEWWVNVSDSIGIFAVQDVREIEPLNQHWNSQKVSCTSVTILKGDAPKFLSFRENYRHGDASSPPQRSLERKDEVLGFVVIGAKRSEVVFWVNLTRPDAKLGDHAAYDNNCTRLGDKQSILSVVMSRIAREDPKNKTKKRGVIIPFTGYTEGEMYWDFVRTADPAYRENLVRELRGAGKEAAIYNLISYPSKDTVELIRPFLDDSTEQEVRLYGGENRTITNYPIRQAAYLALSLLGEKVARPQPYYEKVKPWLFDIGFEDRAYFPYGGWQRWEP